MGQVRCSHRAAMTSSQQREQAASDISRMWGQLGVSERYLSRDLFAAPSKWASSASEMQWEPAPCIQAGCQIALPADRVSTFCRQPLEKIVCKLCYRGRSASGGSAGHACTSLVIPAAVSVICCRCIMPLGLCWLGICTQHMHIWHL